MKLLTSPAWLSRVALAMLLLSACAPLYGRGSAQILLLGKPRAPELGTVRYLKSGVLGDDRVVNRRYAEAEMRDACGGGKFTVDHEWEESGQLGAGNGWAPDIWQMVRFRCAPTPAAQGQPPAEVQR